MQICLRLYQQPESIVAAVEESIWNALIEIVVHFVDIVRNVESFGNLLGRVVHVVTVPREMDGNQLVLPRGEGLEQDGLQCNDL